MRIRPVAAAAALLVPLACVIAAPAVAGAAASHTLYVNNRTPFCTDTGATAGSTATPFCTVQAAADAASAGGTVEIFGGAANAVFYPGNVTMTRSGTASAPITFEAIGRYVDVGSGTSGSTVTVKGASYVDIVGFTALKLDVEDSAHVSVSRSRFGTVTIGSGSSSTALERNDLDSVIVGSGAAETVIAANIATLAGGMAVGGTSTPAGGISVSGATGTDITNNTFDIASTAAVSGIAVTDSARGTSIENNVMSGNSAGVPELSVDASSAAGTTERYNDLTADATGENVPYAWAGTDYSSLAGYQAASGQGAADVLGDFDTAADQAQLTSANPAVNSADSAAPGVPATDFYGNAWAADVAVTPTGVGPENYYDRGAVGFADYTGATLDTTVDQQSVEANLDIRGMPLGDAISATVAWGDGSTSDLLDASSADEVYTDFTDNPALHQYTSAGTYIITATITDDFGTRTFTSQVTTGGSTYVPVNPARVLDTRTGLGAGTAGAIAGGHSVSFSVTAGVTGAPAGSAISAVVLNVTVTGPQAGGFVAAYPDGTAAPKSSNVNYSAGQTVPNLTTVMVGHDGKVDLYTNATTQLVADVQGYYIASPAGSGYKPFSPTRLLDTRKGIGAPAQPVGPGKTISLQVSGNGSIPSSGVVAAAMNVTVTQPSSSGLITVFPQGGSKPNTSNVNYTAGETVANMAVVKLGTGGRVQFTNTSGGTVQIIADVAGYYTSTGGDAFIPMAPWRALDTRNGTGQESSSAHPVAANSNAVWWFGDEFDGSGYSDGSPGGAAALVVNVTVTQPTANGLMIAYPGPSLPTASNSNFTAGQTLPAMVMAACNQTGAALLYNESAGTTQMIADVFGYFS